MNAAQVRFDNWLEQQLTGAEGGMYSWGCPPTEVAMSPPVPPTVTLLQENTSRSPVPGVELVPWTFQDAVPFDPTLVNKVNNGCL